jgi:hypothetical protein
MARRGDLSLPYLYPYLFLAFPRSLIWGRASRGQSPRLHHVSVVGRLQGQEAFPSTSLRT